MFDRLTGRVRRSGLWVVGVAVGVVVAGCAGGGGAAGSPGSSGPDAAKVVFVAASGNSYSLRVAEPDGRSPTDLLPAGYSPFANLVAVSDDGSVLAVVAQHKSADGLLVVQHRQTRVVPVPADGVVLGLAVAADGHAVYFGADNGAVLRWDVATGTESTLCPRCALYAVVGSWMAVSPDTRTLAIASFSGQYGGPTWLYVVDAPSGRVLWKQSGTGADLPNGSGMVFANTDTLVLPIGDSTPGHSPVIHQISGLRSGHPVDTSTGVSGYGPIRRLDVLWWYYRDNPDGTTTAYVNPDLTPAGERKLADRVDGPTSFDYLPVTTAPLPAIPPATTSPTPSS